MTTPATITDETPAAAAVQPAPAAETAALQAQIQQQRIEARRKDQIVNLGAEYEVDGSSVLAAINDGMSYKDFAAQVASARHNQGGNLEASAYARPKKTPDYRRFDLDRIVASLMDPGHDQPDVHQGAEESLRAVEVMRASIADKVPSVGRQRPDLQGILIPDVLLYGSHRDHRRLGDVRERVRLEAATTTSSSASGIVDPNVLIGDYIDLLTSDMSGSILGKLKMYPNLPAPLNLPSVTAAPTPSNREEGAAAPASATLSVGDVQFRPHQLICRWNVTVEQQALTNQQTMGIAASEASRLMAEKAEEDFWTGSGTGGAITGVDTWLAAQSGTPRVTTYVVADGFDTDDVISAMTAMTVEKVPTGNRAWVATPHAWARLITMVRVEHLAPLVEGMTPGGGMMLGYDAMSSSFPEEAAAPADGRIYHVAPMEIAMATFGGESELLIERDIAGGSGDHLGLLLKLFDIQPLREQAVQVLKEA